MVRALGPQDKVIRQAYKPGFSPMTFSLPSAHLTVPDGKSETDALARITHLGIGAHPDDLEFMAFHGIVSCFESEAEWFGGVTCTDGAGSARVGAYADYTDEQMRVVRREEQDRAAVIGRYGAMIHLAHPSASLKNAKHLALRDDLLAILRATRPRIVYTHNLADKHDTHIAVAVAAIEAMRILPAAERPERVYGCEGWRDLDWMPDDEKICLDVSGNDALAAEINAVFESQIAGGKRYDLGVIGRRRANATFFQSHAADSADSVTYAMDLTPLVRDPDIDLMDYAVQIVERFREDVKNRVRSQTRGSAA